MDLQKLNDVLLIYKKYNNSDKKMTEEELIKIFNFLNVVSLDNVEDCLRKLKIEKLLEGDNEN